MFLPYYRGGAEKGISSPGLTFFSREVEPPLPGVGPVAPALFAGGTFLSTLFVAFAIDPGFPPPTAPLIVGNIDFAAAAG
jgi:hypothetical protein